VTRCALKGIKLPSGVRLLKGLTFYSAIFRDYELGSWFEFRLGKGLTLDEAEEQIATAVKAMRAGKTPIDGDSGS
jgi:hypothetical protein